MSPLSDINPEQFEYSLPAERIARYPVHERDYAKLLVYQKGNISSSQFRKIESYLTENDIVVVNNTRVIRARLFFYKPTGARIEIFCLEPHEPQDYDRVFTQTGKVVWKCLVGNARKWKGDTLSGGVRVNHQEVELKADIIGKDKEETRVCFSWDTPGVTFGEILEAAGKIPLPPYLNREAEPEDTGTYQTLFARYEGSVAAPTAGLHFSERLIDDLRKKVTMTDITLHVGAGTFKPVKHSHVREHTMHTEHFEVTRETIQTMLYSGKRVVSVGTTTVRTLESLYWLAEKISTRGGRLPEPVHLGQWDPYEMKGEISRDQALEVVYDYMSKKGLDTFRATTQLMIVPGYTFRMTEGMVTNFHLPRSSLLMLIAAFIGSDWKEVYQYALDQGYRFLSYGDGSLLLP